MNELDITGKGLIKDLIVMLDVMHNGDLGSISGFDSGLAICEQIRDSMLCTVPDNIKIEIKASFKSWVEFSGSTVYPVGKDPQNARTVFNNTYYDMWIGSYGNARRRLAGHMADHFRGLLAEIERGTL